jgi:hypothetical protein
MDGSKSKQSGAFLRPHAEGGEFVVRSGRPIRLFQVVSFVIRPDGSDTVFEMSDFITRMDAQCYMRRNIPARAGYGQRLNENSMTLRSGQKVEWLNRCGELGKERIGIWGSDNPSDSDFPLLEGVEYEDEQFREA